MSGQLAQSIEILVGDSWSEGRMGERIRLEAGSRDYAIDFAAILDTMDIFIDGANISASAREDAVFLMLRDMLAGCEEIVSGRAQRVCLPFYESPWEIVLTREGERALVSFYRGGPNPLIEVKDRPVPLADLVQALIAAGESLISTLEELNPKILADPFVGEVLGALERLRAADAPAAGVSGDDRVLEMSFDGDTDREVSLGFRLEATSRDFLSPTTPNRADLYALMARGTLTCRVHGREVIAVCGHVFFMVESLVTLARHLLSCLEEHRDLDLTLYGDTLRTEVHHDAGSDVLAATLSTDVRRSGTPTGPAVLGSVPLISLVDAILAAAGKLRSQILDVNPSQRQNLKFELMCHEIETLGAWKRDLTEATLVNTGSTQLRYEVPRPTLPRRLDGGAILGARRLMYAKRWDVEAEGLRLDATFLCGDRMVIGTRSIIAALDRDTGDPLWRRPGLPSRALALMTGETGLLTMAPSGEVSLVNMGDGRTLWTTRIPPPPGKPVGMTAGGGRRPRYAVLTTEENGLVAIDLFTGEVRWRFRSRRGSPAGFARFGRLIAFTCRTNAVYCLDVDSGDLVWRFSERSRFDLPPVSLNESLAVWSGEHEGRQGRIFVLDATTGEVMWSAQAEGRPLAAPVLAGGHVIVALTTPHGLVLRAWTASGGEPSWHRVFDAVEGPVALLAMDDAILVHTSQGLVASLDAGTGRQRWIHSLTDVPVELPISLEPVLRDGGLFIPFDTTYVLNPTDGSILHRLETDSPVPDLLRVDENYSIYTAEISGHVSAYGVVGHLNVVKN